MVRPTPGNAATPLIPLTLAMMKDRRSPYFAQLDPASGRILNASALACSAAARGPAYPVCPYQTTSSVSPRRPAARFSSAKAATSRRATRRRSPRS